MKSFLQLNTIFISILIESMPFVLIGVFISGIIQMFVTEEMVQKWVPKNNVLAVLYSALIGALFPACECGIVPITRRLVAKGVPLHAAVPFMLTGPIINPVVLFATYIAFGSNLNMLLYRSIFAVIVAVAIGLILSVQYKDDQLRKKEIVHTASVRSLKEKWIGTLEHTIDEFFSSGKYLIIGAFIASAMQTYVKTSTLLAIGQGKVTSTLVMMALAFVLSLCSEADAFIASSFQNTFSFGALTAFLVFGPMLDIKNTLMLFQSFKTRFVIMLIAYISIFVFLGSLLI
ncbi:permease [Anoxybacteroides amylolyticum]|uniref:Putative permease family protein n=1 Tax=Anoxybacteroides amylolyticum TaxID=294699 RepID=A0A161HY67_9BACL|nr:permease [Anoxybacillus amylolyticus]ANB60030.1 putative permease family protein [Anoxybacillus amylolyticus]